MMKRLLVLPLLVLGLHAPAYGDDVSLTFTVNATQDLPDATPGDGACAAADGHCTLRAAVEEVTKSGSQVAITLPAGRFTLTAGALVVSTDVALTGAGAQTILDAGTGDGILSATGGGLSLTSLQLHGGEDVFGGGAAVQSQDTAVELHQVQIGGAHSDQGGGALEVVGGSVLLDHVFVHDSDGRNGGALSAVNAAVAINDSTFQRDTATGHGGALFLSYPSALSIAASTFDGDTAIGQGGAVYLEGRSRGAKPFTIGGTFTSNSSRDEGGAVFVRTTSAGVQDGTVTFTGATFTDNAAKAGGAVGLDDGTIAFTDSTFSGNTARAGGGGAIAAAGDLTVAGSTFTSNSAATSGGAISSVGVAKIDGSSFSTNSAGATGGALALLGWSQPSVTSSPFTANTAPDGASALWRGGDGLTQSKNTFETDQSVVIDRPARKAESVSLAAARSKPKHKALYIGAAAAILLMTLLLAVQIRLLRRSQRKAAAS
jgi:predicted outer membrane repeat protein